MGSLAATDVEKNYPELAIGNFLTYLQSEDITPGTIAQYRANLLLFGEWIARQGLTVSTLTPANLRDYREELKQRYKPATINGKLGHIKTFLEWCRKNGLISHNPATKIKPVRNETIPKWLSQTQVQAILKATQEEIASRQGLGDYLMISIRGHVIAVFLLNTGLRVSELCDLKLCDISDGVITVRWGKGSKRREVPMNEQARAAIETWLKVRNSKSEYLFASWNGRITRQVILWHLAQVGKRLGFRLTPHLLRHTFGKSLADRRTPLDQIAKLMGHSNINTTAIYTMPNLDDLRRVVESLDSSRTD